MLTMRVMSAMDMDKPDFESWNIEPHKKVCLAFHFISAVKLLSLLRYPSKRMDATVVSSRFCSSYTCDTDP